MAILIHASYTYDKTKDTEYRNENIITFYKMHTEIKQGYQITIVAFKVENFDCNHLIVGDAESTMNQSANTLTNLLVESIIVRSDWILLLIHDSDLVYL